MANLIADQPEVLALAQLASVSASKIAGAFNDPEHFFTHLDLEELKRIQDAWLRQAIVQKAMLDTMETYVEAAQKIVAELEQEPENAD